MTKLILLALATFAAAAAPPDFRSLDAFLDEACAKIKSPTLAPAGAIAPSGIAADAAKPRTGCAVVLVRDGKVVYRRAVAGFSLTEAYTIASASKWLSAAVVMKLVEEGKVSLEEKAGKYFPAASGPAADMTIRQMFSHTAGLPGSLENHPCMVRGEGPDCVMQLLNMKRVGDPGMAFAYGANSMNVAGRMVELAAGKPISDLFDDRIGRPLGMKSTELKYPSRQQPQVGAGFVSSAEDYAKFVAMILNRGKTGGKRVLSEKSIAEMERDQTGGVKIVFSPYTRLANVSPALPGTRYGLGVWLEEMDANGRGVVIGSQGAWGFSPWVDREAGIAGVFATVSRYAEIMPQYMELKKRVREIARSPGR